MVRIGTKGFRIELHQLIKSTANVIPQETASKAKQLVRDLTKIQPQPNRCMEE